MAMSEGPWRARRNYLRSQGMLLIFWDLITIPLVLADATEDTQNFLVLVSHCTVWYWIVDLFYNFFTGYDTGAGIEMILGRHGREQNAGLGEMFGTPSTWVTSRWDIHSTKSVCPCQMLQGLQGESLWDAVCKLDFGWLWWTTRHGQSSDSAAKTATQSMKSEASCENCPPLYQNMVVAWHSFGDMAACDASEVCVNMTHEWTCSCVIVQGWSYWGQYLGLKKCKTALEMSDISVSDACRIAWFSSCLRFHHKSEGTPILGKPYIFFNWWLLDYYIPLESILYWSPIDPTVLIRGSHWGGH